MKCQECGAEMRKETVEHYDVSDLLGISLKINRMPALRCPEGHGVALLGRVLNDVTTAVTAAILNLPHRLPSPEARFLRRVLGITQAELADRMSIARETVAQWECGARDISPAHDFMLRTIVIASTLPPDGRVAMAAWIRELIGTMTSVRSEPPKEQSGPDPLVVQAYLDRARELHTA